MSEVTVLSPSRVNFGKFYFLNDRPGLSKIGASYPGESPENLRRIYQNSMKILMAPDLPKNELVTLKSQEMDR